MSTTLPQWSFFQQEYHFPTNWKLSGHSRALERTGFLLAGNGIKIVLDAGIDMPDFSAPDLILLTHSHIDHCNSLPMLYRLTSAKSLVHIFAPALVINRLRQFVALSFSIKVDDGAPIPPHYQPPEEYKSLVYSQAIFSPSEAESHRWHPVTAGLTIPLGVGKGGKKDIQIQTVKLYHTISTIGYIISEKKTKLRPDLNQGDKKLTNECVAAARARGEIVTIEFYQPILAYLCDTTAKVLYPKEMIYPVEEMKYPHATMNTTTVEDTCCCSPDTSSEEISNTNNPTGNDEEILQTIFNCPIIMIECTYLEESLSHEAERRGHVVWSLLQPVVFHHFTTSRNDDIIRPSTTFILIHFSLRYSDEEITSFFMDSTRCLLPNPTQIPPNDTTPPHLILWLDTGIIKLWYQFN